MPGKGKKSGKEEREGSGRGGAAFVVIVLNHFHFVTACFMGRRFIVS